MELFEENERLIEENVELTAENHRLTEANHGLQETIDDMTLIALKRLSKLPDELGD